MRHLARIFSALVLLGFLAAGAALIWLRPQSMPPALPPLVQVERIVIEKAARRMRVFQDGKLARDFRIALGADPNGDKQRQGDGRTPEGRFRINRKNAVSAFHLSLGLDYPQTDDRARARAGGYDPGGDIMIHGQPNALPPDVVLQNDWTAGCIALSNDEIAEVFAATPMGTEVEITP